MLATPRPPDTLAKHQKSLSPHLHAEERMGKHNNHQTVDKKLLQPRGSRRALPSHVCKQSIRLDWGVQWTGHEWINWCL